MLHMPASLLPLSLHGICYDAGGRRLIDGITTTFERGEPTVILGPNGAGKSLLLRLCHGLLRPTGGEVNWQGPAAQDSGLLRFGQAMVFQKPVLLRRSVLENVVFPLRLRGMEASARQALAMEMLQHVGLAGHAGGAARVLSGGEQQRLALARAWALKPQILFLDEPTANLDPAATMQVEQIIADIAGSGTKIVMTTHDLGQAKRLAADVIFLHRGRMTERTTAATFFSQPASDAAKAFLNGELTW